MSKSCTTPRKKDLREQESLDVLSERHLESELAGAVLEQTVAEVAGSSEHDVDGKSVHVECVQLESLVDGGVFHDREHERDSDTICGSKVIMERHEERKRGTHRTRTCTPTQRCYCEAG
jgi:hypothetical protein